MSSKIFWISLQNFVNGITYLKRSPWLSSVDQPDQIKTYAGQSHLFASRIFRPVDSPAGMLPLVIRVHGGGFVMNSPATDDSLARFLADQARCIVVAIDYRKAPRNVFPAAYEDIVAQTIAIMDDAELNIDPQKVILCGTSAGGNLILAAAQDARLQGKLLGVMGVTPLTDRVPSFKEKMATRPDPGIPDFLQSSYESMGSMYPGVSGIDDHDVRISPVHFNRRADLPAHAYINAAEHDLLAREAEVMAEKLAQGQPKITNATGWDAGTVKFTRLVGVKHAFEGFPEKDPAAEAIRLQTIKFMYQDIADWIKSATSK